MELLETLRGNQNVLYNRYHFTRFSHSITNGTIRWKCSYSGCTSTLITDMNISQILKGLCRHNHKPPKKREAIKKIMRKKKRGRGRPPLNKQLAKNIELTKTGKTNDIEPLRHSMIIDKNVKRIKDEMKGMAEGLYSSLQVTVPSCEEVLQMNSYGKSMVCFTTISNLELLCESSFIIINRTSIQSSRYFRHLFTIYCSVSHQPFAHFLLPEDFCSFKEMFKKLLDHCSDLGMRFQTSTIKTNLDEDDVVFIKNFYPDCLIQLEKSGFTVFWWMKIQDLLLTDEFLDMNSSGLAKWLRWTFPMFYLNHADVANSFLQDIMSKATDSKIIELYSYYLIDSDTSNNKRQDMESSFPDVTINQFIQ